MEERTLTVKSKTENLAQIRSFVQKAALDIGFEQSVIDNIILAVDEACTNIIKHAYHSIPEGEILIKLSITTSKLVIEIIDYGAAFKPESIPTPDIQEYYIRHKVGGLGMYLMKTLMDEVKYNSVPGKYNKVLLSKKLKKTA